MNLERALLVAVALAPGLGSLGCASSAGSPPSSLGGPASDASLEGGAAGGDSGLAPDAPPADGRTGDSESPLDASSPDGSTDAARLPGITGFAPGTNLSSAAFGPIPGVYGTDYIYPPHSDVDYFTAKGFRIFRIPFLWERMQPTLGQALDPTELGRLTDLVTYATSKNAYVLVDPHNYARYDGNVVGDTGGPTAAQFGDFWSRLAIVFAANPAVVFGLMNEPYGMATELWLADANAAIAAIRDAGAQNLIFVPGNGYTGAYDWTDNAYGTPNSTVMLGVKDPLDNYVFEVHQYLNSDSSGSQPTCVSATIGSERLMAFTQWMSQNHVRGFLGEFGVSSDPTCLAALDDMLSYIDQHRDAWVGWTWWSAGPWWGSYMFSIEPNNGADAPQMATLLKHL
jgi:endoglucanase